MKRTKSSNIFEAIAQVESNNCDKKIGKAGERGRYQLTEVFVDDINRIVGYKRYTYNDRLNPSKSRAMMRIFWSHYKCMTNEEKARKHNGGPKGMYKYKTKAYWDKVRKLL
jgi:hypothetical protein